MAGALAPFLGLLVVSGAIFLALVTRFGYFNDDWYLMYAAGVRGPAVFSEIYSVDRPMRALVMAPAYMAFGPSPLPYNISAWLFRALSATAVFLWLLTMWPGRRQTAWLVSLLFLIYPGFLSQSNGIDYQSQTVSLAAAMLSVYVLLRAYLSRSAGERLLLFLAGTALTSLYLGLVEYFVGFEALKVCCLVILAFREPASLQRRLGKTAVWSLYSLAWMVPFFLWRLYIFQGARGATDINLQLGAALSTPLAFAAGWFTTLLQDVPEVFLLAWYSPLRSLLAQTTQLQWLTASVAAGLIVFLVLAVLSLVRRPGVREDEHAARWRAEAAWLGVVTLVFGVLPVILVGRSVAFEDFSRYALAPSLGAALVWVVALQSIPSRVGSRLLLSLLTFGAALTHYLNGFDRAEDTSAVRAFWWQVSWRIPQLDPGTTLVARYPIETQEDYFVWGPANLIYYPDGTHSQYVQPGVYASVLSEETVSRILASQPQNFSNRRGIRTYPNYRHVLVLSQPTSNACVQVLDGNLVELSTSEDARVVEIAQHSESGRIDLRANFRAPPRVPFGPEPEHDWCFFYEKASFARQGGDWIEVTRLGREALNQGLRAGDAVEWLPFLQGWAIEGDTTRLSAVQPDVVADPQVAGQACRSLGALALRPAVRDLVEAQYCGTAVSETPT